MTTLPNLRPPPDDFHRYERPGPWDCGRACEGRRCKSGPAPSGRCLEVNEPCVPQRSLRSRRRTFVVACTVLSLAAMLVMLSKACWTEVFAPGPLTLHHAQILNKDSTSNRCAACHEAGDKTVGEWALSLVSSRTLQTPQSTLCLKCHEKGLDSAHALLPHGVAPERLAKHTAEVTEGSYKGNKSSWTSFVSIPKNSKGEIGCAACHREHHGKDHDLAMLSNTQCQTCHTKTFHSFASGHPEFTQWPFEKRGPVAFDHAGHQAKHFPAGKQAFRCGTCHVDDPLRDTKLLAGFQTACATCHEPKIKQSGEAGFPLFALPGMNVEALSAAGHNIGQWPEGISSDFDGVIPPTMALLLSADERAARALAKIPGGDLLAIDAGKPEQLSAAAEVALAIKRLLHELAAEGESAFARRLKLDSKEASQLWAHLPADVMRSAQSAWLPRLKEEMTLLRAGQPLPPHQAAVAPSTVIQEPKADTTKPSEGDELLVPEPPKADKDDDLLGGASDPKPPEASTPSLAQPAPNSSYSGWQRSDTSFTISWRPAGHADPLLKAWIELSLRSIPKETAASAALRVSLTKPTSIGYCVQCHRIDAVDDSANRTIHWSAAGRESSHRSFTKFSHRPHLIQPELSDCSHCHALSSTGFAPLSKSACASCHTAAAAGDKCLQCHNYHISPR